MLARWHAVQSLELQLRLHHPDVRNVSLKCACHLTIWEILGSEFQKEKEFDIYCMFCDSLHRSDCFLGEVCKTIVKL